MTNNDFASVLNRIAENIDNLEIKGINNIRIISGIIEYMQSVLRAMQAEQQANVEAVPEQE